MRQPSIDITQVKTTSVRQRKWLLGADHLASVSEPDQSLRDFLHALPRVGEAARLLDIANLLGHAALARKPILWIVDSGTIDAGVSPLLVHMIGHNLVQGLALSGEAAVRDYEMAFVGATREDLAGGLADGRLGLSRETGEGLNEIINEGVRRGFGIGQCLSRGVLERHPRYGQQSLLFATATRATTLTIHLTMGADGFQHYPGADGTLLGKGSLKDAYILGKFLSDLPRGLVIASAHTDPALTGVLAHGLAIAQNQQKPLRGVEYVRLGSPCPVLDGLELFEKRATVQGPLELLMPMLTGALFCLVN